MNALLVVFMTLIVAIQKSVKNIQFMVVLFKSLVLYVVCQGWPGVLHMGVCDEETRN